jgi:tetratricopeptide (TPR) repeat protein
MAEPLMRLCLEVKNQHGRPLRLLARFLRAWFPVTELESKLIGTNNGRVSEYCKLAIESGDGFKGTLAMTLGSEIDSKISDGDLETAERLIKELEFADPSRARSASIDQATARLRRGVKYHQQGDFELALSDFTAVVEMRDAPMELRAWALVLRGVTYGKHGEIERALMDYSAVIGMTAAPVHQRTMALFNRGVAYRQQGDFERALSDISAVVEMRDAPVDQRARALINRGFTYGQQGDIERNLSDYSAVVEMPDAPVDQRAIALFNRGVTYHQRGDFERALSDYSAVVEMPDAPVEPRARALVNRGVMYGEQGDIELAISDYSAVIALTDAPMDERAMAFFNRGVANRSNKHFLESEADFEAVLAIPSIPSIPADKRIYALFAIVEPMIDHCSLEEVKTALARAFEEGDPQTSEYGGAPHDLLWMVLGRSPSQWANYISVIASMYIEHGCEDKLGQGITKSIQHLDEGGFSKSQIESWNAAWQQAGQGCDALEIPLRCLDAAVEVMNSDPRSDRALFRLPLELRGLIRPLLNRSLGET